MLPPLSPMLTTINTVQTAPTSVTLNAPSSNGSHMSNNNNNNDNNNGGGNRVWIQQAAIDAATKPGHSIASRGGSNGASASARRPSGTSTGSQFNGNTSLSQLGNSSFTSLGSIDTFASLTVASTGSASQPNNNVTTRRPSGTSFAGGNSNSSNLNSSQNWDQDNSSSSCGGATCENSHVSSVVSHGRQHAWGWKAGWLLESTGAGGSVVVRLAPEETDTNTAGIGSPVQTPVTARTQTISLGPNALKDGQVVLCNDYETTEGMIMPPHDLITLTHLHEPAVVESLQHRYVADLIYTNTGPVLIALNPFQNVRGLYGNEVMKKYWDKAEKNSETALPPHVYAIADNSFRSMMRGLEDNLHLMDTSSTGTAMDTSTSASTYSACVNQSILVSGESGAGKTVTTKFVMKYLAALSQRSAALQAPATRAFAAVAEQKQQRLYAADQQDELSSSSPSSHNKSPQPSWAANRGKSNFGKAPSWRKSGSDVAGNTNNSSSNNINSNNNSNGNNASSLSSVTVLAGTKSSSIEAQVLQSNPILESFGNARTVRNDNSSRFGKFIEIQFTASGKLVGACVETYLLEKVRLVTQSDGERNYHVFFELLSGAMDPRELSQYYLAPTARPDDFCMTAAGTYDRRDGVTDKETYRQLRLAMNTMKFSVQEQKQVFSVVSALLHASNLTFSDLPDDESALEEESVHLLPVCHLLGVTLQDLNQSLCSFSITAGNQTVRRSLTRSRAEKGLEALLKATYGALFSYLVKRINDSISFKEGRGAEDDSDDNESSVSNANADSCGDNVSPVKRGSMDPSSRPAASIGVLDIFGFESFTKNSFEQLCINYCNEALQQQFNAFVLKNEQAEYEREGIEWSFIEFPENQDVLDLIEKRGVGILSILDDQCRAPGPSDKSFALDVYSKCKGTSRLTVSRKQRATLQFSVHHYAGPVEYTSEGFTEKNRDELPKETTELLKHSEIPFIQELARLMEGSHEVPLETKADGTPLPKKFHRADSSVGRATVGGQFRRQLRNLRIKIDATSPHYVRCLKPNDFLVPDHFDTAIVAEQLRCGGILEAVRVARAGFTQHYPHADFVRRYRALAWRELNKKDAGRDPSAASNRGGNGFRNSYQQKIKTATPDPTPQMSARDVQAQCQDLIKVLYRKLQQLERQDESDSQDPVDCPPSPSAKATSYSPRSSSSSVPSWSKGGKKTVSMTNGGRSLPPAPFSGNGSIASRYTPWEKKAEPKKEVVALPPGGSWSRRGLTLSDYAKVGIQMGKTKVFLRHKAFEALERIRSREQMEAATSLNAIFRMYLARMAYVPYRDAFRHEIHDRRRMFEQSEFKECKDQEYGDEQSNTASYKFHNSLSFYRGAGGDYGDSLVDKWIESQVRDAIHNPVPREDWGKQGPTSGNFKWVISEGIWVKNHY
jgi:hypothetical protein